MSKKFKIVVDGVEHIVDVEEFDGNITNNVEPVATVASSQQVSGQCVLSPLQGTVQSIKVKNGQNVKEGEVLLVIEAMKMENDVPSTISGTIKNILVQEGQKVDSNQPLVEF